MYENYQMKKILENELERLKPEVGDSLITMINKNVSYGTCLLNLRRVYDEIFINNFAGRIWAITNWLHASILPDKSKEKCHGIADRIYNSGFCDGYHRKKAEDLAELILTPPYNRISEN